MSRLRNPGEEPQPDRDTEICSFGLTKALSSFRVPELNVVTASIQRMRAELGA